MLLFSPGIAARAALKDFVGRNSVIGTWTLNLGRQECGRLMHVHKCKLSELQAAVKSN
jgi:hypothetical protein